MCDLPLRQQATEAIHDRCCDETSNHDADAIARSYAPCILAADAVVALLNLTEEHALTFAPDMPPAVMERRIAVALSTSERPLLVRYVTPWHPSTPPDTSSSETT